jgi:hypothetical protein
LSIASGGFANVFNFEPGNNFGSIVSVTTGICAVVALALFHGSLWVLSVPLDHPVAFMPVGVAEILLSLGSRWRLSVPPDHPIAFMSAGIALILLYVGSHWNRVYRQIISLH